MIDTHIHLYDPDFDADRDEVVARAKAAGVKAMVLASVSEKEYDAMLRTEARYPHYCFASIGLQPEELHDLEKQMQWVETGLKSRKWLAIGEVGLDYHYDNAASQKQKVESASIHDYTSVELNHRQQQEAFRQQIRWALDYDLPLLIHSRDAFQDTLRILQENKNSRLRGVMHCYSGSAEWGKEIMKCGDFYFGIGGVVTFKNAKLGSILPSLGLDRLVLETDAPYLAPTPHRGTRNESAYLTLVAQKIAEVFGTSSDEIGKITDKNACQLLGNELNSIDT